MIYNSFSFLACFPLLFVLYYAIPARCGKFTRTLIADLRRLHLVTSK